MMYMSTILLGIDDINASKSRLYFERRRQPFPSSLFSTIAVDQFNTKQN